MISFLFHSLSLLLLSICIVALFVLLYCLIQDLCINNTKPKRGMTARKKKLKQKLIDHYLVEKEGYKTD